MYNKAFFLISAICKYEDRYLLLKIKKNNKYCPRDWDFFACRPMLPKSSVEFNINSLVKEHLGINGKIIKRSITFEIWDKESKIHWIICPLLIEVDCGNVVLGEKYIEYKWVKLRDVLKFDRLNYFKNYFDNVDFLRTKPFQ